VAEAAVRFAERIEDPSKRLGPMEREDPSARGLRVKGVSERRLHARGLVGERERSALKDPEVSEVMVNGPDDVYVERKGRIARVG
jgi:Flp pilus assembly CpaF family ATPase